MANPCLQPQASDFRGYPWGIGAWSYTKTVDFIRNNCPSGQTGSSVPYTKVYTSYISEADLDAQVAADAANYNTQGQANANANGTCSSTCTAKTTTSAFATLITMNASTVYLAGGILPLSNGALDPQAGCFSVPRSTLTSGNGAIPTQTFIHNISTRAVMPGGSTSGYRMTLNSNNLFNYMYGSTSSKCQETIQYSDLPSGGAMKVLLDYKTLYLGLGAGYNGLYYLTLTFSGTATLYFQPDSGSLITVGNCVAPAVDADSTYAFYSPTDGLTRAFIVTANDLTSYVVAYVRRYNTGLTSFDSRRTRTIIWRIDKDGFGVPTGVTQIYHQYNNDRLVIDSVAPWGSNNVAIFYRTLRGSNNHGILSFPTSNVPSAGLASGEHFHSVIGDSTHMLGLVTPGNRIRVYTVGSNSWSNGRINL